MIKFALIASIIVTLIYMVVVYFELDRPVKLKMRSLNDLIDAYVKKPTTAKRTVVMLECDDGLCLDTLKSVLDQSVRVHEIALETSHPERVGADALRVAIVHKPGTAPMRECDAETQIFRLANGKTYPFDFIENNLK